MSSAGVIAHWPRVVAPPSGGVWVMGGAGEFRRGANLANLARTEPTIGFPAGSPADYTFMQCNDGSLISRKFNVNSDGDMYRSVDGGLNWTNLGKGSGENCGLVYDGTWFYNYLGYSRRSLGAGWEDIPDVSTDHKTWFARVNDALCIGRDSISSVPYSSTDGFSTTTPITFPVDGPDTSYPPIAVGYPIALVKDFNTLVLTTDFSSFTTIDLPAGVTNTGNWACDPLTGMYVCRGYFFSPDPFEYTEGFIYGDTSSSSAQFSGISGFNHPSNAAVAYGDGKFVATMQDPFATYPVLFVSEDGGASWTNTGIEVTAAETSGAPTRLFWISL